MTDITQQTVDYSTDTETRNAQIKTILKNNLPEAAREAAVRVNHPTVPGILAIFKTPANVSTESGLPHTSDHPQFHLISTDEDNPIVTTQPHSNSCSGCGQNQTYMPLPEESFDSAITRIEAHDCIHANIARDSLKLGSDEHQQGGEPCSECGSWEYMTDIQSETVRNGEDTIQFTTHTCSNCGAERTSKHATSTEDEHQ
jgi:hypothetical protein